MEVELHELTSALDGGEWPLYLCRESPQYPLGKKVGSWSGHGGEEEIIPAPAGNQTHSSSLLPSHYTD